MESAKNTATDEKFRLALASGLVGGIGGAAAAFGPIAGSAAVALGNFVQSIGLDLIKGKGDWAFVNCNKAGAAAGVGGIVGLAFGAEGASYGRNIQIADWLSLETLLGSVGDYADTAVGNAFGNAGYP